MVVFFRNQPQINKFKLIRYDLERYFLISKIKKNKKTWKYPQTYLKMRSQHREVSKEDKIAILRQEFDQIDINHDDMLSPEELNDYLDQLVFFLLFYFILF